MNKIFFSIIMICFFVFCGIQANAAHMLSVSIHNQDEGTPNALQFPGINNLVTGGNLWIVSPQYLHVQYQSTGTNWAIRLVSRNNTDIGSVCPKPLGNGTDTSGSGLLTGCVDNWAYIGDGWGTGYIINPLNDYFGAVFRQECPGRDKRCKCASVRKL